MSSTFSELDRSDLKEMFRIFDFSKVEKVDDVVRETENAGKSPRQIFDDLYTLYKIQKLPQRDTVAQKMHQAVPKAGDADVESVLRQTEMKGFGERDAIRSLERKFNIQHMSRRLPGAASKDLSSASANKANEISLSGNSELLRTSSRLCHALTNENNTSTSSTSTSNVKDSGASAGGTVLSVATNPTDSEKASVVFARPQSHLSGSPTRESIDEVMAEDVREWLAKMLGDAHNADVLNSPNYIDALRNGILLHVLLQKMQDPPVADEKLKLPRRSTGFFVRDNVATFLKEAKQRYSLVDAQLFTDSDLVDGKSDRQVVTCLMSMARTAYSAGTIKVAPSIVTFEQEIERRGTALSNTDLDRIVQEAEADEVELIPLAQGNKKTSADLPPSADAAAVTGEAEKRSGSHTETSAVTRSSSCRDKVASPAAEVPAAHHDTTLEKSTTPVAAGETETVTPVKTPPAALPEDTSAADGATPAAADRTRTPDKLSQHAESSQKDLGKARPHSRPQSPMSPTKEAAVGDSGEAPASLSNNAHDSPKPASEDLHTPPERGISATEEPDKSAESKGKGGSASDSGIEEDDEHGSSGRVFYLRDGMLRSSKPTPEEEHDMQEHRKKSGGGPRVVWKAPSSPLAATKAPRYHSRHWDGIDIALGQHLNQHYEQHPQSPWRFHMVAATSGEYVLYNRQNALKRVVYVRVIQTRLFLRNAGKNQPWVGIDVALADLEKSK